MRSTSYSRHLLVLAGIVIYLSASLTYFNLPGLQYDEVLFANAAMGNVDGSFVQWELKVGGKRIPLMLMPYLGAPKAYLYAPIFKFFGTNPASVRLPVVFLGLVTLLFTYKLARAMLGEKVAILSFFLLATDPAFIFANRLDWGPVALMMALKMFSLYLFWCWLQEGKGYLLGIASFLLGLGLFDKVIFVWFLGALAVALPLCFRRELRARLSHSAAALGLACFLLGCWPLIAYNIKFPLATFTGQKVVTTSWADDLAYRYYVFRQTLDGSAVNSYVNDHGSGGWSEMLKRHTGSTLDLTITYPLQAAPLERTFSWYAFLIAPGVIVLLWCLKRLEAPGRVLFFLLQVVLTSLFLYATAQATGPHHVVMVHPFTHILTAVALYNLARMVSVNTAERYSRLRRLVPVAGAVVLIIPHIIVDAGYLKSFRVLGGVGNWSDAIYQLAGYASANREKSFMLMDWGFSNQLLLLTGGKIKKKELFVHVIDLPKAEEKMQVLYPYITDPSNLFVFHPPHFETFPVLDVFQRTVAHHSLDARLVKTFYQRNGQPIYLVYKVDRPQMGSYARSGRFFYFRQAEEFDSVSGGGIESMRGASQGKLLGQFWGRSSSDFASCRLNLRRKVSDTYFHLRYAFGPPGPRRYYLFLDQTLIDILTLQDTGGLGHTVGEWQICSVNIGTLAPGEHELKLTPAGEDQAMNQDYIYLTEGELQLVTTLPLRQTGSDLKSLPLDDEILGYLNRPEVRLEVTPPEVIAGRSSVTVRVVNLDAPAIDVVYSIDGKIMPPIYGWELDANYAATVRVDRQTRKGLFHYLAIRDSRDASPTSWIRVDVPVRVK